MEDVAPRLARRFALVIVYALGIFVLSSIPGRDFPNPGIWQLDKVVHFFLYAGLAGLLFWTWRRPAASIALATLYGIIDELHQHFTPGRTPSGFDALADLLGATAGVLLVWFLVRRARERKQERRA